MRSPGRAVALWVASALAACAPTGAALRCPHGRAHFRVFAPAGTFLVQGPGGELYVGDGHAGVPLLTLRTSSAEPPASALLELRLRARGEGPRADGAGLRWVMLAPDAATPENPEWLLEPAPPAAPACALHAEGRYAFLTQFPRIADTLLKGIRLERE